MNKQTVLNFTMVTVIVVLLFYIRSSADGPSEQPELNLSGLMMPGCRYDAIGGFTAANPIEKGAARTSAETYAAFASGQGNSILGGVISKAALDSLFCGGDYNGMAYQLAMDPSGKIAPANTVFVIIGGVKIQEVDRVPRISAQGNNFYTPNMWCPPGCLSLQ